MKRSTPSFTSITTFSKAWIKAFSRIATSLVACLLMVGAVKAQTNVANYPLSVTTGNTYTALTGDSTLLTSWDNERSGAIRLGGTFVFGGTSYTTCYISGNGYITFGAAPAAANYTPLNTLGSTTGAIAGYGLDGSNSTASGASPKISIARPAGEFVVQFKDYASYSNRASEKINFQIRLNLTTNAVTIIYGSSVMGGTSTATPQLGLRGGTTNWSSNVNSLMINDIPTGTTCNWANGVTGSANSSTMLEAPSTNASISIPSGLQLVWTATTTVAPVRTFSAVSSITSSGATVSWTAPTGATQYNVQYRVPGTCAWTNWSGNPVSTNSVTLTGLSTNTTYQVRVQASNGTVNAIYSHIPNAAGTGDGYATTGTFTTLCAAVNIPYVQDFQSVTTPAIPTCTSVQTIGSSNSWLTNSPGAYGFNDIALRYRYSTSNAANSWWYTQGLNLTAGTSYRVAYKYGSAGYTESMEVKYGTSPDVSSMTLPLASYASITTSPLADYVDFTPSTTGVYYIGFHANSIADQFYLLLDSVNVTLTPSCLNPTAQAATGITLTGATANWTSTGTGSFIVEYGLPGFTPGTDSTAGTGGTVVTAAAGTTSVAITGLSSSTTYQYYVRQVCSGPSYSANSAAQTFTTACTAISTFPWSEGFEGVYTTGAGIFPACWSYSNPSGSGNPGVDNQTYTGTTYGGPRTGTKFVYTQYSDTCWFFTPQFQLTGGNTYTFSFWMQNKVVTSPVDFLMSVGYGTTNSASGMTNVLQSNYSATNSSYQQFSYTITPASSGAYYFGVKSASATTTPWVLSFDDFGLVYLPACSGAPTPGTASLSNTGAQCSGNPVTMTVAGYSSLAGITLQWQSKPTTSSTWANISGATSASYTDTPSVSKDYQCVVTCTNSSTSATTNTVTQVVNTPTIASTTGATICGPGTATLAATTGAATDTAIWYASNTSTTVLGRGASFTTPTLSANTTYYVAAKSGPANVSVGPTYTGADDNANNVGSHGIMFTTTQATTIISARIPFTGTGTMTIAVRDASNSTTYSSVTTGTVTGVGANGLTIPLNLSVPAAGNYTLIMTAVTGTINALGYTATNSFPYTTPAGDFSITAGFWYGSDVDNLYFFNLVVRSACVSSRTPVTVTYTAPPSISVTPATASICSGDSVAATVTGAAYTTFTWTPTGTVTPPSGASVVLRPTTTTTYTIYASGASGGCTSTATLTVTVNPLPNVFAVTPAAASLCSGTIQTLAAADTASLQLKVGTQANTNGPAAVTSTSADYPAPYSVFYGGQKMQILILASELTAAGFRSGATFQNVQFPVASLGSAWGSSITYCNNFRVKMGLTTATSLTSFATGLTVVVPQNDFTPTVGYNNTHTFTTPFVWDGTSNVILETNFSNNITGSNAEEVRQYNSPTAFQSCLVYRVDATPASTVNSYSSTPTYTYNARPDFKLNGVSPAPITWSPATELFSNAAATTPYTGTASNTVYAKPTATRTYTATATIAATGCTRNATTTLTVSTPSVAPTAISGTMAVCSGGSTTLTATGGSLGTGASYVWGTGTVGSGVFQTAASATATVTPSSTTSYWVSVSGPAPCGSPVGNAATTVTVATPSVVPTSISGTTTICAGENTTLTAVGGTLTAGDNYVWGTGTVGSGVFQTSASATATVTPSSTTTYWVSVSGAAPCGSPSGAASVAVTVRQAATATANTVHTATINNNATYTLHASVSNNSGYTWTTTGTGALSNTGTLTPVYTPATGENGTIQIILTAASAAPCAASVSDTFLLTINATSNTWIGNTSDWFTAGNWTAGVPNSCAASPVTIPVVTSPHVYPVLLSATAQVNNITVASGAQVTIASGQKLGVCGNWVGGSSTASTVSGAGSVEFNGTVAQTVSGNSGFSTLAVNKTAGALTFTGAADVSTAIVMTRGNVVANSASRVTLKSNASGTAYLNNFSSSTAGTWSGNLTVERYVPNATVGYRDISSPVTNAKVSDWAADFTVNGPNAVNCWYAYTPYPTLQYYSESTNSPTTDYYGGFISTTAASNPLTSMKGYAARLYSAPLLINTTGTPGTGTISTSITRTPSSNSAADGWNLIGNPYPSPISWNAVKALNAGKTDGSAYLFQATGEYTGNWATWNGTVGTNGATDQISSTQGFMVLASGNNTISMDNTVRVAATASPFFKTRSAQPDEIRLTLAGAGNSDEIVSYTDANASAGYDAGYDAAKIAAGSSVYLSFDMPAKELAINVMNQLTEATELPLKVAATEAGDYTLTATELNTDGLNAYLKDGQTGTLTNLATTTPVLRLAASQYYTGRYSIVFRKSAVATTAVENVQESPTRIYSYQNKVYIQRSNAVAADVDVTNVLGQNVAQLKSTTEKTEFELPATEPWYAIVRINENGKVTVQKVLINATK